MADPAQHDIIYATSPAQAHAFSHPTRHRILRAIRPEGSTISQLTNRLGINKGNVAHHLGVLVQAGLVRKGPARTVRGGTEQYYLKVARKYRFDPGADGVATKTMLAAVADEVVLDDDHMLNHRTVRLTAAQARALNEHLESLVDNLEPASDQDAEFGVLIGLYRRR